MTDEAIKGVLRDAPVADAAEPVAAEKALRLKLKRRFPTAQDLRRQARRNIPTFAFEFMDGGAGADGNIERNWAALDAVELVPRYGKVVSPPPADVTLFGRTYAAPVGIAPVGGPAVVFPGADLFMARAAQAVRVPYVHGVFAGIDIERAAQLAPDVLWLQLYRFARNDHTIGFDLVKRAEAAGVHVLMLTVDTPTRTVRPREVKGGILTPFRLDTRLRLDALSAPRWLWSMRRHGIPKFANFLRYLPPGAGLPDIAAFTQREGGGAFTWEEIARYRDKWRKPLLLKGVLHPEDAERAVALGLDGIVVSNHGGRQIEALPASIDVLPAIARQVGGRAIIIFDSGVRSGVDVARAVALGADLVLVGKAVLWSLGALGSRGPRHLLDVMIEDCRATLGQLGCHAPAALRDIAVRHRAAYAMADFTRARNDPRGEA